MYIYKITCKNNGKIYIGKTHKTAKDRWRRHVNEANNYTIDTLFARAIRKYGEDAFVIETIDSASTAKELQNKEQYWIKYYKSNIYGYNMTPGGDGNNTYERKTEDEMNEIKNKIRNTKLGKKNPHSTKVKCKNINTKEVMHFDTVNECSAYFNKTDHSFVTKRINNPNNQYAFNRMWLIVKESDEFPTEYTTYKKINRSVQVKITNIKTDKSTICRTINDASKIVGVANRHLSKVLQKRNPALLNDFMIKKI